MREWDAFEADAVDLSGSDEVTALTEDAHQWALGVASAQFPDYAYAVGGSRLRLLIPRPPLGEFVPASDRWYVAEVRGQSAATGHGKQGALPGQIAQLREMPWPVLLLFKDHGIIQSTWLHNPIPVVEIDKDRTHRRQGWRVKDMERTPADEFRFPESVPEYESGGLF